MPINIGQRTPLFPEIEQNSYKTDINHLARENNSFNGIRCDFAAPIVLLITGVIVLYSITSKPHVTMKN